VSGGPLLALAWAPFQPRTVALARALGGQPRFIAGGRLRRHRMLLPLRYLRDAATTWPALGREDPQIVLAVTPPVFSPLMAWLWCATHGRVLLMDCHTDTFHSRKWAWAAPLHRWLARRARVVLLHTEEAEALVAAWGARGMLLPDDLPEVSQALPQPPPEGPRVLVAGSLDANESLAEAIAAAGLLPDVEVRFTGDPSRVPRPVWSRIPPNAVFTGYLPYPQFLGELQAAHVVAAFSTDPHIMNRAAFEAVGLGRPLVLSDIPGLRARFGPAALYCPNEPAAMATTLRQALLDQEVLAARSVHAQERLQAQRQGALRRLQSLLSPPAPAPTSA